jgi:hypothetical protein
MSLDFQRTRPLLQSCDLPKLFIEELGWEPCRQKLTLHAGESDYALTAIAEKRGFIAWLCETPNGGLPSHDTRLKLDRKLSETSFEHLIVFVTGDRSSQSWLWVRREQGKPLAARTHEYHHGQPGDSLLQKLQILYVSLEEEEAGLSTVVVAGRARAAFDIERVTKAFYRDFDAHRKAFVKFIDGIGDVADCEWYASVMLNRLMFVYFIQRKGFLDADPDYLRHRLQRCQQEKGKDKFYTFYRYFLLRLFHEGFGKLRRDRAPDLEKLLGSIPYLNGGLFDVHELEKPERYGKDIQIPDKAFERIFDYFDQYQWHLDERPLRKDDEINPDVLGYIFEKYINQKQMGAYYTKEDITEYISKNTVLPFLFDDARAKCKVAFENPNGPTVWDLLRENPDRYFYDAAKKGVEIPLPKVIESGIKDVSKRSGWNKLADEEYRLPTEIWREVVARRQRYEEVRRKLVAGEVREVNDFITLNLDLRQFGQDVIQNCEGPDLLMALWQSITTITVLDPTGGSGAFIFAALNVLEPLYEACLDRMEAFLSEWGENGRKAHPNYHKKFTEVLDRVDVHPNRRYFVLKSIILNNLYAVDIMEEAVEICKLRLFLKLAAQVEPDNTKDNLGIEPLPDIDFNIRSGNSLVGYATYDEVKRAVASGLDFDNAMEKIAVKAADLQQTFDKFRQLQTEGDGSVTSAGKQELQKRLKALEDELNRHLAGEYGVKVSDKAAYAKWLKSYQPFHWFIQFYGIINSGGFDVIIGNPPYVEYTKIKKEYVVRNYVTEPSANLYAFVSERSLNLLTKSGSFGFIVPISVVCTQRMKAVQDRIANSAHSSWFSDYAERPSKLFEGAEVLLTIALMRGDGRGEKSQFTTGFTKWAAEERTYLFGRLSYCQVHAKPKPYVIPKLSGPLEVSILEKMITDGGTLAHKLQNNSPYRVYYRIGGGRYWKIFTNFQPRFVLNGKKDVSSRENYLFLPSHALRDATIATLSSSLFYWYFILTTNCRDLNPSDLNEFPINLNRLSSQSASRLVNLCEKLMEDYREKSQLKNKISSRTGNIVYQEFYPRLSKPILDEIDTVLAGHYGFTAEELDFIINYDIKYRLGRDTDIEEGD